MKAGSIVKHVLSTAHVNLYQISSIELDSVGKLGIVKMICLTEEAPPLIIPSNMISAMREDKTLDIYNKE